MYYITLYNIAQVNIYNMNIIKSTKNSLLFLFKTVPVCILFSLIFVLVMLVSLIPNITIRILIYIFVIVFAFPIYYLAWFLYSSSQFDKYINAEYYPDIVDKGIVRKER